MTKQQVRDLMESLNHDCYFEGENYMIFDGYYVDDGRVIFYFDDWGHLVGIGGEY